MRQNKRADNLYTIEQKAQKLFSSDEASLLEDYEKLIEQIRIRGIKPVTEEEYERRRRKELGEDEDSKPVMKKIGWKIRKNLILNNRKKYSKTYT